MLGISAIATGHGQDSVVSARELYTEYQQSISNGDFLRSEILLEQILDNDYSISEYQYALIHNALGYVYYETGRLREALEQYRIAEEHVPGDGPREVQLRTSIHINLGVYYNDLGDYTHALEQNNEAVRLLNSIPVWDELSLNKLSALLLNKGITLYRLGRYDEALDVLKECAQIKEANKHPYLGSVYFNLARVYHSLDEAEQCNRYYLLSIAHWSSEHDPDYYELANIYLHYGEFITARGEPVQGSVYLQKALQNYRRNSGDIHPLTAS